MYRHPIAKEEIERFIDATTSLTVSKNPCKSRIILKYTKYVTIDTKDSEWIAKETRISYYNFLERILHLFMHR